MFLGHVVLTQAGISPQPAVFWELLGRGRGPSGGLQLFPAIGSPPHEGIPRASPGAVGVAGFGGTYGCHTARRHAAGPRPLATSPRGGCEEQRDGARGC